MSVDNQKIFPTDDMRIAGMHEVSTPNEVFAELPLSADASRIVSQTRTEIHNILHGEDDRLVVVIGPCSIHDVDAAHDYAERLSKARSALKDDLLIVMRVYFEKPRTTVGWKGLINDPDLNGTFQINKGLRVARKLLLDLADKGLPAATEFLDLISPQYLGDVVSWGAIGARTTESQCHRELSSGLSCPIGFKNGTQGNVQIAVDAISSSLNPHHFLSVTKEGRTAIFATKGNEDCHIILRGGSNGTNFDAESVEKTAQAMEKSKIRPAIMIDCSHANSQKQHDKQKDVANTIAEQLATGDQRIMGVMVESHLKEGRQNIVEGHPMTYGQSITDACINWEDSLTLLNTLAEGVRKRRKQSS